MTHDFFDLNHLISVGVPVSEGLQEGSTGVIIMSGMSFKAPRHRAAWALGAILATIHLLWCIFISHARSEGSWQWFPIFAVDFPFSIIPLVLLPQSVPPILAYGVLGSIWWFVLGYMAMRVLKKIS
jgi:hypothetical protein